MLQPKKKAHNSAKEVAKKTTVKVTPKKKTDNDVKMYNIKGKILSGEGNDAMDQNYNMLKKNGGSVKKAQNYGNLKVKNPTAKDSLRYKSAYDKVMNNQRLNFPSRVEAQGSQEALKKLKDMKSKSVAKSKSGSRIKKAANGTSLGMKSVKAGFDKNPGVTRADIITAAKGKAKSGKTIKKGQNSSIMRPVGLDIGKSTPSMPSIPTGNNAGSSQQKINDNVKKINMSNVASSIKKNMAGAAKNGKSMKKCKYGCK